jgi:hypothetical protein
MKKYIVSFSAIMIILSVVGIIFNIYWAVNDYHILNIVIIGLAILNIAIWLGIADAVDK